MPKYDLAAVEQQIRASLEATDAERSDMVRAGTLDLPFAMAMKKFDETRVQFVLAGLRLENEGCDRNVALSAAGQAIGSMWGNGLNFALGARERAILNGWVQQALASTIGEANASKTVDAALPAETEAINLETAPTEGSA